MHQIVALREMLADILESQEEWTDAAKMLQGIPLESTNRYAATSFSRSSAFTPGVPSHRSVTDEYRLKTYVRIVRLLLEDSDTVSAQTYLNRAQGLIRGTNDQETIRKHCLLFSDPVSVADRAYANAGSRLQALAGESERCSAKVSRSCLEVP